MWPASGILKLGLGTVGDRPQQRGIVTPVDLNPRSSRQWSSSPSPHRPLGQSVVAAKWFPKSHLRRVSAWRQRRLGATQVCAIVHGYCMGRLEMAVVAGSAGCAALASSVWVGGCVDRSAARARCLIVVRCEGAWSKSCWVLVAPGILLASVVRYVCALAPRWAADTCNDIVSERLRRWTRNPLGSARRGSNPLGVAL